jgi:hypothetical protein
MPARLFGAHVPRRAHHDARVGAERHHGRRLDQPGLAVEGLREAEVEDLDDALRSDLDIGRLQIAMDDAPLVRGVERRAKLAGDPESLAHRRRATSNPLGECLALDQFQDQRPRGRAVVGGCFLDAVNGGNIGMVKGREHLRFTCEACHAIGILGDVRRQDFESDLPSQPGVARPIDLAHPAGAERRQDLVHPE